jgi:hypothetical protein
MVPNEKMRVGSFTNRLLIYLIAVEIPADPNYYKLMWYQHVIKINNCAWTGTKCFTEGSKHDINSYLPWKAL